MSKETKINIQLNITTQRKESIIIKTQIIFKKNRSGHDGACIQSRHLGG